MASSLDPDNFPQGSRQVSRGRSLGPGDSSDSGSDMAGPASLDDDVLLDAIEDADADLSDEALEAPADDAVADAYGDAEPELDEEDEDRAGRAADGRRAWAGRRSRGRPHASGARGRRASL